MTIRRALHVLQQRAVAIDPVPIIVDDGQSLAIHRQSVSGLGDVTGVQEVEDAAFYTDRIKLASKITQDSRQVHDHGNSQSHDQNLLQAELREKQDTEDDENQQSHQGAPASAEKDCKCRENREDLPEIVPVRHPREVN